MNTNPKNVIPSITDPMGKYWDQPNSADIAIDDTHALLTGAQFDALHEYSSTVPSGVYPGKMWKRHDGIHDPKCKPLDVRWLLCWFGIVDGNPNVCSNNFRVILCDGLPIYEVRNRPDGSSYLSEVKS